MRNRFSRRHLFQTGGVMAAGLAGGSPAAAASVNGPSAEVYTRLGVRPFINCTATLTINDDGSLSGPPEGMLGKLTKKQS